MWQQNYRRRIANLLFFRDMPNLYYVKMFVIRTQRRDDHIIDIRKRKAHYNCFYDVDEDDDDDNNNTNYILPK